MKNNINRNIGRSCCSNLMPRVIIWVLITVFPLSTKLWAVGYRLPNQDPEAIARGNAFAATADNPSAIYYNPAGITQLDGQQISAGIYLVSAGETYTSPSGVTTKANSDLQPVPQLYYTCTLTNVPISFGLGIYAPYGLSLDWGDHAQFNTLGENGKVLYLCFNPVVAWRVNHTLSIAIGPTINYSQANLNQAIGLIPGDQFSVSGDGTAFGFNAGVLWQPDPMWSFGVNYRSSTTVDYSGTSQASPYFPKVPSTSSIKYPQFVVGGISFRPSTNWNFEFDLDWTEWSSVQEIVFRGTSFGDIPLVLDYSSSFKYEVGATRQLGNGYFVSVGYIYSENSSPSQTFSPLIPDADLQLGSIGVGHHGQRWDWAIAYHFAYNGGRTINNNYNPQANGTYKTFNNAFNISTTFKF